jgi:hypothetical protein
VPHGILRVFNTILYENEFQNPQIFQQTISLFPEHSTLFAAFLALMPMHWQVASFPAQILHVVRQNTVAIKGNDGDFATLRRHCDISQHRRKIVIFHI